MTDLPPPGPLPAPEEEPAPDAQAVDDPPTDGAAEPDTAPLAAGRDDPPHADDDADDVADPDADAADPDGGTPKRSKRNPWTFVAAAVLLAVVGVGGYLVATGGDDKEPTTTSTATGDVITVTDDAAGFTLAYPKAWITLREPRGDERLLVGPGDQNYLRVRVLAIDPSADVKADIETGLASADPPITVLQSQQVDINGTPGYVYVYAFDDPSTQQKAVHLHYFLIRGSKMYVLVFQALPTDEYTRLAKSFTTVADTFKATNDNPAPTPTSTTVGPEATTTTAAPTTPTS